VLFKKSISTAKESDILRAAREFFYSLNASVERRREQRSILAIYGSCARSNGLLGAGLLPPRHVDKDGICFGQEARKALELRHYVLRSHRLKLAVFV
jgi:hypothetical protein